MKMRGMRVGLFVASAWLIAISVAGQQATHVAPAPSARFPAAWYPPDNDVSYTMTPVTGAPYEARVVQGSQQDSHLPIEQYPLQARDSAGRTRTESPRGARTARDGTQVEVREIGVNDPVSQCSFQWEEPWGVGNSVPAATVQCQARKAHYAGQAMWASAASMKPGEEHPSPDETDQTEALGERTFDGVRAVGYRRVRTIRNPQPEQTWTIESEIWSSPEMKEVVAIHVKDAPSYSMELRDIKLREPDPALFYPPANYKIESVPARP
jgi:hypothetical protein